MTTATGVKNSSRMGEDIVLDGGSRWASNNSNGTFLLAETFSRLQVLSTLLDVSIKSKPSSPSKENETEKGRERERKHSFAAPNYDQSTSTVDREMNDEEDEDEI